MEENALIMKSQINNIEKIKVLNELIENTKELPLESQNLILMIAKGMSYTKGCLEKQNKGSENK